MSELAAHQPLRAAIIGAGLMGRWHAAAVRYAGQQVAMVFDADVARASNLARQSGSAVARTLDEAISHADVVHVCTPLDTHVDLATQALGADRSVICEKPIALEVAPVRALCELAAIRKRLIVPTHQFVLQRGVQELLDVLPSLGAVLHIDTTAATAGATGRDATAAESVALEVLPHPLSLVERIVAGTVAEMQWAVANTPRGEIRASASTGGCSVTLLVSCAARPPVNTLRVVCARGTAMVDLFHGFVVIDTGRATRWQKIGQPFRSSAAQFRAATGNLVHRAMVRESAYPGLRELIRRTYDSVATGAPAPISVPETLAVTSALEQIRARRTEAWPAL